MKLTVYAAYIPKVGGIETITYNLTKVLARHGIDITLVINSCENDSILFKFAPYCNVIKTGYNNNISKADVCLVTSNHKIPDFIKADRYIQWIHSDYKKYNIKMANLDRADLEYIAVSNHAGEIAKELYGIESTTIMNFPDPDLQEEKIQLRLVTASRLSPEKGKNRMLYLAKRLKEKGVKFVWTVCGDSPSDTMIIDWKNTFKDIEEVSFVGFKKDITPYIMNADYSVLLSDFEGCPMALLESIKLGVPVITTSWGGAEELVKNGKTGYIVPMNIEELTDKELDRIVNNIPTIADKDKNFTKDCVEKWISLLEKKK